ncbi:MAG: replication protein [Lactococcus lactis]|nr:replication protein [Lactococcus lactis]
MKKTENQRTRNWTFVVYPESVVPNWKEELQKLYVPLLISPLHDKDVNPDGTPKKAHYHVLLMFEGVKSYDQILKFTKDIKATIPQICHSAKGLARYMAHLDNPNKAQYKIKDIISLNGADLTELLKPSSQDRYTMIKEMLQFISNNQIMEFEDILVYAMNEKFDTWFPLLCDNSAYIIGQAINSRRNRYKEKGETLVGNQIVNHTTGELKDVSFLQKNKEEPKDE